MKTIYSLVIFFLFSLNSDLLAQIWQIWPGGNAYGQNCNLEGIFLEDMPGCNTESYTLAFEDNFDGNVINVGKWEIQPWHTGALYNNGNVHYQEYNTFDNLVISGGTCKIVAKKETVVRRAIPYLDDDTILEDGLSNLRQYNYTSSALFSKKKFGYGKYEIRCKLPSGGKGFWPAFWMYGGPRWNELDVFDNLDGPDQFSCGPGYDYNNDGHSLGCRYTTSNVPDPTMWHTYTCIFDVDKIIWKIDNSTIRTLYRYTTQLGQNIDCNTLIASGIYFRQKSWPIDGEMSIIMNLAILKGNETPADNLFPNNYEIDYVRYWTKEDNPCDGCISLFEYKQINQLPSNTRAKNYISAGNDVTVSSGQDVTFKAPEIVLKPGTSIFNGSNFTALPEACNLLNYERKPLNFIGNNCVIGTSILDRCFDPVYKIYATGVEHYSFRVYNMSNPHNIELIHSASGVPTSNEIPLWNTSGSPPPFNVTYLTLTACPNQIYDHQGLLAIQDLTCRLINVSDTSMNYPILNKPELSELKDASLDFEFLVFPNPSKDEVNVSFLSEIRGAILMIYDTKGVELLRKDFFSISGVNKQIIDVRNLTNGVYFIKIFSNEKIINSKFIISK
jgi:beta-glucanase (GH16 family)